MRPVVHKSAIPNSQLFVVNFLNEKHFDPVWHAHSEYQLFVVLNGTGTRFIGDSINSFKPDELIFTGPNLPHLWRSDEIQESNTETVLSSGIVIYFDEHFLGQNLLSKVEMKRLKVLFNKSKRGLEFYGDKKFQVTALMKELVNSNGIKRLVCLLQILDILAMTKEYQYVSSKNYKESGIKEIESDRLNRVYEFIIKNYQNKIPLKKMADMSHMTPTSFSRYFAIKNNMTYSRFLAEIRIKNACKMLLETDVSVADVCYKCGFNTLSNFNKKFKEIVGKVPTEYKNEFLNV